MKKQKNLSTQLANIYLSTPNISWQEIVLALYVDYYNILIEIGGAGYFLVPLVYCGWYLDMSVLKRACFPAPGNKGYLVKWLDM